MKYKAIFFDLDGTLTESGEGIIKSVQYALNKMGRPAEDAEKLRVFIGPPLLEQFMAYAGLDKDSARQAVAYYRERYSTIGIFENQPYPGIEDLLKKLHEDGYTIAVSSSKPEFFVRQILDHFHLTEYFDEIVGSTMSEKRTAKAEVIEETLYRLHLCDHREQVLMVGDKEHDVIGAREEGIECIAVSYGYGTMEELKAAHPKTIVHSVEELGQILLKQSCM